MAHPCGILLNSLSAFFESGGWRCRISRTSSAFPCHTSGDDRDTDELITASRCYLASSRHSSAPFARPRWGLNVEARTGAGDPRSAADQNLLTKIFSHIVSMRKRHTMVAVFEVKNEIPT
jgi:hypothetical protein